MADKKSFWTSLPGILTEIATIITALTGLFIALNSGSNNETPDNINETSTSEVSGTELKPTEWPLIEEETFSQEPANWSLGNYPHQDTPRFNLRVVDGVYRWDIEYSKDSQRGVNAPAGSAVDFYLGVDSKMTVFTPETGSYLSFNIAGNTYYTFDISSNKYYRLYRHGGSEENAIIDWTPVNIEFNPYDWNRLSVVCDDQRIKLFLNAALLAEYRDSNPSGGKVGFGVTMWQKGAAVIDFDNFQFRRKP